MSKLLKKNKKVTKKREDDESLERDEGVLGEKGDFEQPEETTPPAEEEAEEQPTPRPVDWHEDFCRGEKIRFTIEEADIIDFVWSNGVRGLSVRGAGNNFVIFEDPNIKIDLVSANEEERERRRLERAKLRGEG